MDRQTDRHYAARRYNVGVDADPGSPFNVANILRRIYRPGDFVAIKLDIDNEDIEHLIIQQFIDDQVVFFWCLRQPRGPADRQTCGQTRQTDERTDHVALSSACTGRTGKPILPQLCFRVLKGSETQSTSLSRLWWQGLIDNPGVSAHGARQQHLLGAARQLHLHQLLL
jgi:hypothetical protein